MATIYADRTRLDGAYHLGIATGTFSLGRRLRGRQRDARSVDAGRRDAAARGGGQDPDRAGRASIGNAISRTARNFNAGGQIRVVNFPGGGAARITSADIIGPGGARARVFGGSGVTYYWPSGGLSDRRQYRNGRRRAAERPGALAPAARRRADERRRRLRALHRERRSGSRWRRSASGRDRADRPRSAPSRSSTGRSPTAACRRCACRSTAGSAAAAASPSAPSARWSASITCRRARSSSARRGCRSARSARRSSSKRPGGPVLASARFNGPVLNGRLGSSPLHLAAAGGQIVGKRFGFNELAMRLGKPASPIVFDAARLTGSFVGVRRCAAISAARRRRSATSRCCSATARASWRVP